MPEKGGPKNGGGLLCPFPWAELGPYLRTKWHLDPSSRLATIHTNVADRTDRTDGQDRIDNGPIAQGEPFYKRSPKSSEDYVLSFLNLFFSHFLHFGLGGGQFGIDRFVTR